MSRQWPIALAQARPAAGADPVAELAADVATILRDRPETRMVVFPEIHLLGAMDHADDPRAHLARVAEPLTGPLVGALRGVAAEAGVWLVPGSIAERDADGRIYNTAVVLDPDGRLVSSYRKVFPWRPHEPWASGAGFTAFDVPGAGRMGITICYDSWFPESTRQVAWLGAEVVLNVVKTTTPDREQELVLARANAITNQVYFLSVNAAGPLGRGHSIHVGPEGEVLAHVAHAEPEVTHLVVDLDRVGRVRAHGTAGLYSFLGFDAVSTLTEDTRDPRRTIPRAIMLVALIGGVVFVTVAYVLTLVEPGSTFDNASSLAADTARTVGGALFAAFFVAGLVVGQFTSGLAAQASVSRLLYAMGRDGVLPRGFFGRLSDRFATPVFNIVLCGLVGLGALFLDVATSTSFINFGAFTAFTLVNLSVIGHFVRHRHTSRFNPVLYVAVPLVGALVDVYLLTRLDGTALVLGAIWLAVGVVYLLVLTRGLRVPPPEMALDE